MEQTEESRLSRLGRASGIWSKLAVIVLYLASASALADSTSGMQDTASALSNIVTVIKDNEDLIVMVISGSSYVIGFGMFYAALMHFKRVGRSLGSLSGSQDQLSGGIIKLVVAALLVFFPSTLQVGLEIFFPDNPSILRHYTPSQNNVFENFNDGVAAVVRIIGFISVIRGLLMASKAGSQSGGQQGNLSKGILYFLGGILAINCVAVVQFLDGALN